MTTLDPRGRLAATVAIGGHGRAKLTEAQVTQQCCDLLRCHGWEPIRMQSALVTRSDGGRYRVGEKGLPDYLCLRPISPGEAQCFWLELKGSGKKPSTEQLIWHEQARNRGHLVCVADSVDALAEWVGINFENAPGVGGRG
jgi:hypothetical protein